MSPLQDLTPREISEKPRILSVEDDSDMRLLLKHQLWDRFEVAFASDTEEALQAVDTATFDLFLIDIKRGDARSGSDLLHRLRERAETAEVPAIALTTHSMPDNQEKLLEKGFDGYVGKPYLRGELLETMTEFL